MFHHIKPLYGYHPALKNDRLFFFFHMKLIFVVTAYYDAKWLKYAYLFSSQGNV